MTEDETLRKAAERAEMRDIVANTTDSMGDIGALLFNCFAPRESAKQIEALNNLRVATNPQTYEDKNQSL